METTFITIHDLSPNATLLYASDSIVDILGYHPNEVVSRPCWDFFHPDELPLAREKHDRGVQMDKAAVLSYCRMRDRNGNWVGCEAVFTVVYDVLVGCTSIYKAGAKSHNRALVAPVVRRLFSSSPRDPRYHMLSHLSSKFSQSPKTDHEPRAALFLNRYTRTLAIMYATEGLADVLGISGNDLRGRSFYFCIAENCLQDAVQCLETAKANDSIAYLRFWYRDPRTDDASHNVSMTTDHVHTNSTSYTCSDADECALDDRIDSDSSTQSQSDTSMGSPTPEPPRHQVLGVPGLSLEESSESRTSSDESANPYSHEAVFGERALRSSSSSSLPESPDVNGDSTPPFPRRPIELEAVVSCTSDGMVVCLRKARPLIPGLVNPAQVATTANSNGLFAVPWAREPMLPPSSHSTQALYPSAFAPSTSFKSSSYAPSPVHGSSSDDFMNSIKECAVFAWGLTGINGTLADHSRGQPRGEALPPAGLAIWDPTASDFNLSNGAKVDHPPVDQLATRNQTAKSSHNDPFGDPGRSSGPQRQQVDMNAQQGAYGYRDTQA